MKYTIADEIVLKQFDSGDFLIEVFKGTKTVSKIVLTKSQLANLRDEMSNFLSLVDYANYRTPIVNAGVLEEMWGRTLEYDEESLTETVPMRWFSFPAKA